MVKIEKLNYINNREFKKLVPFFNRTSNNFFINDLFFGLLSSINGILPLKMKFADETYLLIVDNETVASITISSIFGNPTRLLISQIRLKNNNYDSIKTLTDYVITKYGKAGISSFFVLFDELNWDLGGCFVHSCGFRQCSAEEIWQIHDKNFQNSERIKYRRFENSDLEEVSEIYNDSIITYFKPTLQRIKGEFAEVNNHGLTQNSSYRYVIQDASSDKIISYFNISTNDNTNFIIDYNYSDGYDIDFDGIMYFVVREISKRRKNYNLFLQTKRYLKISEPQKSYFVYKNFEWIRTELLLAKDFYKQINQASKVEEFAFAGQLQK